MAQVLKDEIRASILAAALDEFFERGYKQATMRSIAADAKIPTGLIYSYYKNKADLFDAVLCPVLYDWERVLTAGGETESNRIDTEIYGLSRAEVDCLLNLFEHRKEFIILITKSSGTKYEHERERFVKSIKDHMLKYCVKPSTDAVYIQILTNNFVGGLMQIMYYYKGKEWAIMILRNLTKVYLFGIGL